MSTLKAAKIPSSGRERAYWRGFRTVLTDWIPHNRTSEHLQKRDPSINSRVSRIVLYSYSLITRGNHIFEVAAAAFVATTKCRAQASETEGNGGP